MWKKWKKRIIIVLLSFAAFVFFNNSVLFVKKSGDPLILLAHRGMSQTFPLAGVDGRTDTSKIIFPPEHQYLENTIASMEAAFKLGADIVEFDVHPTRDGRFAVFHDWEVGYRTQGKGVTRDHTMSELKALDVGYGYTADGGKTFPFRGKGVGMMPSIDEVFEKFPDGRFLIHIKSNDSSEGELLADFLGKQSPKRLEKIIVYGGDRPVASFRRRMPHVRSMSKETLVGGLLAYVAFGWSGHVPDSCARTLLMVPEAAAPWLWGWPDRFVERMKSVGTVVTLVAGNGKFSEGFDSAEAFKRVPAGYSGAIWTNRVDRIAPLARKK